MALCPRTRYIKIRKEMRIPHPAVFRKWGSDVSEWEFGVTRPGRRQPNSLGLGLWCDTKPRSPLFEWRSPFDRPRTHSSE